MFESKIYRLTAEVIATDVDDDGNARFPDDTPLPEGSEFEIVRARYAWPTPSDGLFYLIRLKAPGLVIPEGEQYRVPADVLEAHIQPVT